MKMGSNFSLNLFPRFLAGERVLHCQPWLWASSGKSLPSYRVSLSFPFVHEMGLCLTDRRVLLSCCLFRLIRVEWTAWLGSRAASADGDSIKEVSVGRSSWLGRYLQLVTYDPVEHWWRSREARIRFFMKNPEPLCRLIAEALEKATSGSEQSAAPNAASPHR